jgi:hypothetical protein
MLDNTQSIIEHFGLAAAAPRLPYWHLELCGIAYNISLQRYHTHRKIPKLHQIRRFCNERGRNNNNCQCFACF